MSSMNLMTGNSTALRYESRRPQIMTMVVTRQKQSFQFDSSQDLADIELMRASVQLMGDPPNNNQGGLYGNNGEAYNGVGLETYAYGFDRVNINSIINAPGITSKVYNIAGENAVQLHNNSIMHDWVTVNIRGMMEAHHFLRDNRSNINNVSLLLPTDMGIPAVRANSMQTSNPTATFDAVKLAQTLTVDTHFIGNAPEHDRLARFVEDFADTDPSTYRNADGTVKYYTDALPQVCQIPANMINCMILEFRLKPRVTL